MVLLAIGLIFIGCGDGGDSTSSNNGEQNGGDQDGNNIAVTFSNLTANGSSSQSTTELTLTFNQAITGLSVSDIFLSGVTGVVKEALSGSGPTYTLSISGFTSGGTLSVTVAKSGYAVSGSLKTVPIFYFSGGDGSEANPFLLTENTWADGALFARTEAQWFKFTATAATQYIHISFGTGFNAVWGVDVRVYDSNGNTVGSVVNITTYAGLNRTWNVTPGNDYLIRVNNGSSGSYRIGFNKSTALPKGVITPIIFNQWSDGFIAASNGEQWFKFTATASSHYIHFAPGALPWISVQLYDSDDNPIGTNEQTSGASLLRSTVAGREYFILTRPLSGYTGDYRICFSTSSIPPGATWVFMDSTGLTGFNSNAITFGGGRFVAVSNASRSANSTNGTSWTEVNMGIVTTSYLGIAYGTNGFAAVSNSGIIALSSNGTSWSYVSDSTFGSTRINGISWNGETFYAVGNDGKAANSSSLGNTWFAASNTTFGTTHINDIAFGNGRFVAVGNDGKAAHVSGGSWTAVSNMTFGTTHINAIAFGGGRFVAVGNNGKAAYSSDGITWTAVNDIRFGTSDILDITYGGGKFVAVGSGKSAHSSDGITWEVFNNNTSARTVTYGNGRFIAAGDGGMSFWITP